MNKTIKVVCNKAQPLKPRPIKKPLLRATQLLMAMAVAMPFHITLAHTVTSKITDNVTLYSSRTNVGQQDNTCATQGSKCSIKVEQGSPLHIGFSEAHGDTSASLNYSSLDVDISSDSSNGLYAASILGHKLNLTDSSETSKLTVTGNNQAENNMAGIWMAHDIFSQGGESSTVNVAGNLDIKVSGQTTADYALYGIEVKGGSHLTVNGNMAIDVSGNTFGENYGAWFGAQTGFLAPTEEKDKGFGTFNTATINVHDGNEAIGVMLDDKSEVSFKKLNISVSKATTYSEGVHVYDGSKLTVSDSLDINIANSDMPAGLSVTKDSTLTAGATRISINSDTQSTSTAEGIIVDGSGSTATLASLNLTINDGNDNSRAITVSNAGTLTISGDTTIEAPNLALVNGGSLSLNGSLTADSQESSIIANNGGTVSINSNGDGTVKFTGYTQELDDNSNISMTINGAASRWEVTRDSQLSDINLSNRGSLVLSTTDGYQTVVAKNLTGNGGIIGVDVDFETGKTDRVIITDNATGSHYIRVDSSGQSLVDRTDIVVTTNKGDATFELSTKSSKVDAGVYLYGLENVNEEDLTHWFLSQSRDENGELELSPTAEAIVALASSGAQNAMYQNSLSDLRKRLGEVRDGVNDGLWASFAGWKDSSGGYAGSRFRQEAYSLSVGLDRAVSEDWLVGANMKVVTADQSAHGKTQNASADADAQGVNLYATWTSKDGTYADFVATVDRYSQRINTRMLDGNEVKGKYHNWGYGLSAEVGRKFGELGSDKTWFVEPQAQLSWYHVRGASFNMSNGMHVSQDNVDSLTGRLGVVAGRDLKLENNRKGQYYVKAGVNHEFTGDQEIRLNDTRFTEDKILGTRYYYGAGVDWEITKNTKFFGQIEREEGSRYTKEIEVRIGLKKQF